MRLLRTASDHRSGKERGDGPDHRTLCRARRAQGLHHRVRARPRRDGAIPRDADLLHHHPRAHATARLARELQRHPRGHGVHGGVLEARVLRARGRHRVLAAERPPPQGRPRPQDGREGRGVDLPAGRARPGPRELRAAAADPRAARPHPLPQGPDQRAHPRGAASGQGAPGRRHQAQLGRLRRPRPIGPGDARGARLRHARPRGAGRARQGAPAGQAPGAARGAGRALPHAPCAYRRRAAQPHRLSR